MLKLTKTENLKQNIGIHIGIHIGKISNHLETQFSVQPPFLKTFLVIALKS